MSHELDRETIDVAPGARLIAISQTYHNLLELIDGGRFGAIAQPSAAGVDSGAASH
jgi:hypothetical protein